MDKKRKRKSAGIWDYFEQTNAEKAKCSKCSDVIPTKCGNTTGLMSHLRKHGSLLKMYEQDEKAKKAKEETNREQQKSLDTFVTVSEFCESI